MDAIDIARIQFAANISFHILFPTITIALGWILLFFKIRHHQTGDQRWLAAYGFWIKIFALTFALGVVSGITMSFQFGTNWPGFMETVGNVAGPLLAYEVLTAFFLEATFLGVMLFGHGRVSPLVHTIATALVAIGTTLSAYWILALNTWMQFPLGFEMIDGQAHVTDWALILFNETLVLKVLHMLLASGLTAAFLVAGISSYRWLKEDQSPGVRLTLKTSVYMAAFLIPVQIFVGDQHGLNTLKVQPEKIAAIEALWETENGAPLVLFGWPDENTKSNLFEVAIPHGASLILTHQWDGKLQGLNEFEGNHPPVAPVFVGFRIMVGIGFLMLLMSWLGVFQIRKRGVPTKGVARILVYMTFSGWVATLAGWYVTEIGRQPWLVNGVLKTVDAASTVSAPAILSTLVMYLAVYIALLIAYITTIFYMARKAAVNDKDSIELTADLNAIGGTANAS